MTTSAVDAGQVILREVEPRDADACARIVFEAFGAIHDYHRFRRDFPAVEAAAGLMGMWIPHPQVWGVVAELDGRVVGSNFLDERDPIRGVGPITIDSKAQNAGIGRELMGAVLERGSDAPGIRLVQDGFHMRSLSLYTSLGFDVTASCVLMEGVPRDEPPAGIEVRPVTEEDLDECEALCVKVHGIPRTGALRDSIGPFTSYAAVRDGRILAYASTLTFWPMAYGVAEDEESMKAPPRRGGGARGADRDADPAPVGPLPLEPRAGAEGDQADERDGARRVPGAAGLVVPVGSLLSRVGERTSLRSGKSGRVSRQRTRATTITAAARAVSSASFTARYGMKRARVAKTTKPSKIPVDRAPSRTRIRLFGL